MSRKFRIPNLRIPLRRLPDINLIPNIGVKCQHGELKEPKGPRTCKKKPGPK